MTSTPHAALHHDADELSRGECLALLPSARFGRLVYTDGALPAVVPVNFLVDSCGIVIRTATGGGTARAVDGSIVAFQADEVDPVRRAGWSVTVVGQARLVRDPLELTRLSALPLHPWASGDRSAVLVVELGMVTGRRIGGAEPVRAS